MSFSVCRRVRFALILAASLPLAVGCVHQSRGAPLSTLTANPQASDGITIQLSLSTSDALEAAARAAEAEGFAIDAGASRPLSYSTFPRVIVGDSAVTLHMAAMTAEEAKPTSVVVLTATYSSRAQRVTQRPLVNLGVPNVLWDTMASVAKRLRTRASGAT